MSQFAKVQTSRHHIRSLDGIRGAAFLMVFFFHYGMSAHAQAVGLQAAKMVTGSGWVGVDLFFVLSGFLITGILLDTREQPHYFRNFYMRRALRIFPLFYGVLFLLLALTPILHLQWRPGHLLFFFHLGNIAGHYDPTLNEVHPAVLWVHLWSLAVEEQFYLVWPLIVLWVTNWRTLLRVCGGMIFASFVLRCLLLWASPAHAQEWSYGELPTHCDGLLCGAVAAILIRRFDLDVLIRRTLVPFALSGLALAALGIQNHGVGYHNTGVTLVGYPLLGLFFSCILLRAIRPRTIWSRMGQTRFLRFFGKYSYGMYVFHNLFYPVVSKLLEPLQRIAHSRALGGVLFVLTGLAMTCVVSVLSFELYERPLLKLKRYFSYGTPAPLPEPVGT